MDKPIVFHLKGEFFDMIKSGFKTSEYRFKLPSSLRVGSLIRFDYAYKPLSDRSAHVYARCTGFSCVLLVDCPAYVFRCFDIKFFSDDALIYRIDFDLMRADDSQVMSSPIV